MTGPDMRNRGDPPNRLRRPPKLNPRADATVNSQKAVPPQLQNPITTPPRAALAHEKPAPEEDLHTVDRASPMDVDHSDDGEHLLIQGGEQTKPEKPQKAAKEADEARNSNRAGLKKEGAKRWSAKTTIFNGRKARPDLSSQDVPPVPEIKRRSLTGVSTGTSAGSTAPKAPEATNKGEPNGVGNQVTEARVAELEKAMQTAKEERDKMQEEIDWHRHQGEEFEEELRLYREDRVRQGEKIEEQERSLEALTDSSSRASTDYDEIEALKEQVRGLRSNVDFWKQKHSEVNHQYLTIERDQQRRLDELHASVKSDMDRHSQDLASQLDYARNAAHQLHREVKSFDVERSQLQDQILSLKKSISSSTKMQGQVTDDALKEEMQTLGHGLQNWVVMRFRKVHQIVISKDFEHVTADLPDYQKLLTKHKLCVLQALISRLLTFEIFDDYFIGLPEESVEQIQQVEHYLESICPADMVNHWRSVTFVAAYHSHNADFVKRVDEAALEVHDAVFDMLSRSQEPSDGTDHELLEITKKAIKLHHTLRMQRAQFTVELPRQGDRFDTNSMEDVLGFEDESALSGTRIICATFPALMKAGDENGENRHLRNVINPAKVLGPFE